MTTTMPLDELERGVQLHERWLASREQEGRRLVLRDTIIRGASLSERRLARVELVGVTIEGGTLAGSQLGGSTLTGTRIMSCDLTEAEFISSRITDSSIIACRCERAMIGGAEIAGLETIDSDFSGANLAKTVIRRSVARAASFNGANMLKLVVEDSELRDCAFSGADLSKAHIYRSDLRGSSFAGATADKMLLKDVRMAGCRGAPRGYETMAIEGVDLSEAGDGSRLLGRDMVEALVAELRAAG